MLHLPMDESSPAYSSDEKLANKVKAHLKATYGHKIVVGPTKLKDSPWFVRLDSDPSTSTEVLADSAALGICRLALLMAMKR
ncbi:MAG: hypothetical protein ACO1QB_16645 [Verrucomicrobiales bacterium]